jgi:hypothetical protein
LRNSRARIGCFVYTKSKNAAKSFVSRRCSKFVHAPQQQDDHVAPDGVADLLPQEARTHPERPDFPSVALLMPDRICCAEGSRWKRRRAGRPPRRYDLKTRPRELNTLGVEPVSYMGSLRWMRHEPRIGAGLVSGHPPIRAFMRPVLVALNVLGHSAHVEASAKAVSRLLCRIRPQ